MANYTSTHTGATIDASVTIISGSGVTQSDLIKLNAVTSTAVELNLLDGVTASTAEINILDGLTATTAELNYLDGADSSITTLSLPDNTTITTFGASLIDDADAASARTTLGVDIAGTDNSTDVTLVTTSHDYLSISGQAITLGSIDISDDTNLVGGDGLALTGDTLSVNVDDSSLEINSDTLRVKALGVTNAMLAGSIANSKLSNSSVSYGGISVALGSSDATPAFDLSDATSLPIVAGTTGTLSVARGGTGATTASDARTNLNVDVAGTDNSTDVTLVTTSHDYLSLSGQAITLGTIDIGDDTNLTGGTGITLTGDTLSTTDSEIVHDNLSGFVANEHIDHSGVSITAGAGLTGGGDITATRDIAVGAGTGVTVNADDIAIGQDVATSADVEFNSVTADIIGDIRGATKFQAKADVALNKGDAVYISGVSGTTPTVDIADANDSAKMPSFGLAASSVSINASVEIITFGTLAGLNTSGFTVGDILFISTNGTSGNTLTATAPSGESSLIQNIGIVQRSHASAGSIKVGGAGRTNATPNLDDGDIFIGNASNQSSTAALNTKIQDYLNTGVNLPSPTFSGDINFTDASTPVLNVTDTTNTVTTKIQSADSSGLVGTSTDHNFNVNRNNISYILLQSGTIMVNNPGNDVDFNIKDSSANSLFRTDAANSRVGILDATPSYTLDVNGTGRFTGAVQLDDNLTVTGDLQVNGTTTTVNQTNLDVSDNIIGLNRGASSNANDSGLIIERGSTGDNAAIIFDESADKFTVGTTTSTPSATGNITVTAGTMVANVEGNVTGNVTGDVTGDVTGNADTATALATGRTISLTGDVTGTSASFDGSGNVNLAATIAANSVALGTDTTGNYMSDLTEGTGIDITHTPAESSNATIALDLTEVGFGGGANRLITDDGDGTVSTEANLTYSSLTLQIPSADGKVSVDKIEGYSNNTNSLFLNDDQTAANNMVSLQSINHINIMTDGNNNGTGDFRVYNGSYDVDTADLAFRVSSTSQAIFFNDVYIPATKRLYLDGGGDTFWYEASPDVAMLVSGGVERLRTTSTGSVVINAPNNSMDFKVEGSTDANLFFVDGSADRVGIGTTTPGYKLEIEGSTNTDLLALDGAGTGFRLLGKSGDGSISNSMVYRLYLDYGLGTATNGFIDFYRGGDGASGYLTFGTSGTEKMRIDSSGNVGIGTTSPTEKLHIYGSVDNDDVAVHIQNAFDDDSSATPPSAALTFTTASNNAYLRVFGAPANTADNHKIELGSTAASSYITFKPSNSEAMRITSGGDVGIGTNSPDGKLNIDVNTSAASGQNDDASNYSFVLNCTSGSSTGQIERHIGFRDPGGDVVSAINAVDDGGSGATGITFATGNVTTLSERMRIDSSGNVGIGTNSPGEKLTIKASGDTSQEVIKIRNSSNTEILSLGIDGSGDGYLNFNSSPGTINTNGGDLVLSPGGSGNVGIGTTSPGSALEVNGVIESNTSDGLGYFRLDVSGTNKAIVGLEPAVGGGSANDLSIYSRTGNLRFWANGGQKAIIDTSGNVGIGTDSPTAKLEVVSSDGTETLRLHKSDTTITENELIGEMLFTTADTTLNSDRLVIGAIKCFAEENFSGANANEGSLQFFTANSTDLRNSAAPTPRMVIDEDGFVGIGTASPTQDLHLHRTGVGDDVYIQFTNGDTGSTSGDGLQIGLAGNEDARIIQKENSPLEFWTNNTLRASFEADGDFVPNGDGVYDLGASANRWAVVYSADLDLSNEGSQNDVDGTWGSYVIQEGEEDLFLINRRNGKKYKFMLQEVQD